MFENTIQETPRKMGGRRNEAGPESRFSWPAILRALSDTETRSFVLSRYRELGAQPADWPSRRSLEAMADALTAAEDWLELRRATPRLLATRSRLRTIRRRLERELWP